MKLHSRCVHMVVPAGSVGAAPQSLLSTPCVRCSICLAFSPARMAMPLSVGLL